MSRDKGLPLKPVAGDPGTPRTLLPPGSPEWCYRTIERLRYAIDEIHVTEAQYEKVLNELVECRAWEKIPSIQSPYGSLDALLKAEIGLTADEARARKVKHLAENPPMIPDNSGPVPGSVTKAHGAPIIVNNNNRCSSMGSGNADYLTGRIARDRPDILERMKSGEFKSVRRAAIEAGIITPEFSIPIEPQGAARRILNRFKGDSLVELVRVLANHAGLTLSTADGEVIGE